MHACIILDYEQECLAPRMCHSFLDAGPQSEAHLMSTLPARKQGAGSALQYMYSGGSRGAKELGCT